MGCFPEKEAAHTFSSRQEASILWLNQAVFRARVAKQILCDTPSSCPLHAFALRNAPFDELHEIVILKDL